MLLAVVFLICPVLSLNTSTSAPVPVSSTAATVYPTSLTEKAYFGLDSLSRDGSVAPMLNTLLLLPKDSKHQVFFGLQNISFSPDNSTFMVVYQGKTTKTPCFFELLFSGHNGIHLTRHSPQVNLSYLKPEYDVHNVSHPQIEAADVMHLCPTETAPFNDTHLITLMSIYTDQVASTVVFLKHHLFEYFRHTTKKGGILNRPVVYARILPKWFVPVVSLGCFIVGLAVGMVTMVSCLACRKMRLQKKVKKQVQFVARPMYGTISDETMFNVPTMIGNQELPNPADPVVGGAVLTGSSDTANKGVPLSANKVESSSTPDPSNVPPSTDSATPNPQLLDKEKDETNSADNVLKLYDRMLKTGAQKHAELKADEGKPSKDGKGSKEDKGDKAKAIKSDEKIDKKPKEDVDKKKLKNSAGSKGSKEDGKGSKEGKNSKENVKDAKNSKANGKGSKEGSKEGVKGSKEGKNSKEAVKGSKEGSKEGGKASKEVKNSKGVKKGSKEAVKGSKEGKNSKEAVKGSKEAVKGSKEQVKNKARTKKSNEAVNRKKPSQKQPKKEEDQIGLGEDIVFEAEKEDMDPLEKNVSDSRVSANRAKHSDKAKAVPSTPPVLPASPDNVRKKPSTRRKPSAKGSAAERRTSPNPPASPDRHKHAVAEASTPESRPPVDAKPVDISSAEKDKDDAKKPKWEF